MFTDYDIIALASIKGGVGKTNTSWHVAPAVLKNSGFNFKIFEIDDNNNSNFFTDSEIVNPDICQTVKTGDKNIVSQIVADTILGDEKIIIDCGGGNDTRKAIELVKSVGDDVSKLWLIPFDRNADNFKGALETAELINDPDNTIFILNGYTDKSEFEWFYSKNIQNFIEIPFSDLFHFSQEQKFTIHDLAQISKTISKADVKQILKEKYTSENGIFDKDGFMDAFNEYLKSERAAELLETIYDNFKPKPLKKRGK